MIKIPKIFLLSSIILLNTFILSGCWNYREVDQIAIVAGAAVDKGTFAKYKLTMDIVKIGGDSQSAPESEIITSEGNTIFDAARNAISISGKKLYWAHAKALIISQELAKEGTLNIIDWFTRDAETRSNINILISQGKTAKEIFQSKGVTENIISFELNKILLGQENLSKAIHMEMLEFINNLQNKGIAAKAPAVITKKVNGGISPCISGTAIFKEDKLIGFIDGEETKYLLFVQNKIKEGLLIESPPKVPVKSPVSLEIFKNKTKIEPVVSNNNIEFNVSINTTVSIDEIVGTANYITNEKQKELEQIASISLKNEIEKFIHKVQSEFGADIFGFGEKLRENNPREWKKYENDWNDKFKDINVNINVKIHIKNSATLAEPLKAGD